jgi:hypothetical protein
VSVLLALAFGAMSQAAAPSPQTPQRFTLVCVLQETSYDATSREVRPKENAEQKSITVSFDRGDSPKIDPLSVTVGDDSSIFGKSAPKEFTFASDMTFGIFFAYPDGSLMSLVGSPTPQKNFRTTVIRKASDGQTTYPMAGLCGLTRGDSRMSTGENTNKLEPERSK